MTKARHWLILAFLLMLVFGLLTVATHAAFLNNTPGIDYFVFWNAGRAFFNHQDPYSSSVLLEIQNGIYRHPATSAENKMLFAYPAYALLIIAPILWLDFNWSQAAWLSFNILLIVSLSYALFPKSPKWIRLSFAFLYPYVFGYILGNFVVTISAFLLIFLKFLIDQTSPSRAVQIVLGIVMAWSSAKPQFLWAFLILFLLYGLRRKLWAMLTSFCASLAAMVLVCLYFRPDWITHWLGQVMAYQNFNDGAPTLSHYLALFLPLSAVQIGFYAITVLALGITAFLLRQWWNDRLNGLALMAWLGFISYLVHPGGGGGVAYAQLIFLVPVFIWAATQKPSPGVALIWAGFWSLSYLCNTGSLLKTPSWLGLYFFPIYSIWVAWLFARSVHFPATTNLYKSA